MAHQSALSRSFRGTFSARQSTLLVFDLCLTLERIFIGSAAFELLAKVEKITSH